MVTVRWPTDVAELEALQEELSGIDLAPWAHSPEVTVGGCFVCFGRGSREGGTAGDRGWAAAVAGSVDAEVAGTARGPYRPGLLAAREGALLASAVRALPQLPDVLLVNATGRDHPRRAGLALHLGWALDLPTVGVTHRPLVASGDQPGPWKGSASALRIEGEQIGWWLRTRSDVRPLAVSPGWRTDLGTALEVVRSAMGRSRTPEPLRHVRRLARTARSRVETG